MTFGISGSAISSLPISSGALSAGYDIIGFADLVEDADTVSAAGLLSIAATATITEADDTLSAEGILPLAGSAAITEADNTVSAAGVLTLAGTAAITEAGDTLAAAGAITLVGSASITEAADTLLSTATYGTYGRLTTKGRMSIRLGISANPISGAAISGSFEPELLFAQEESDTVSATATLLTHGYADITEADDAVVFMGARRRTLRSAGSSSSPRIGVGSSSAPRLGAASSSAPRIKIKSAA